MAAGSFTTDITAIRKRAREKMEEGPVTESYGDKKPGDVIAVLNEDILADEEEHADDLVDLLGA